MLVLCLRAALTDMKQKSLPTAYQEIDPTESSSNTPPTRNKSSPHGRALKRVPLTTFNEGQPSCEALSSLDEPE